MRKSNTTFEKYKKVCDYFPNFAILTKSAAPGGAQIMFTHRTVGNKSFKESVAVLSLVRSLDSHSIVSIKIIFPFATDGDTIRLTITEFLLRAAAGNLTCLKKQQYWTLCNAVLLLPLLTDTKILDGGVDAGGLLKIFACYITEIAEEGG